MAQLLALARQAAELGEVPVAAGIVDESGTLIAQAHNAVEQRQDSTAHAEMLVLREAMRVRGSKYLLGCTLYVTLEPCAMCAGAIAHAKLSRLVFAAYDPKGGAVEHGARLFLQPSCHHRPEVIGGVMQEPAGELLQEFFRARR